MDLIELLFKKGIFSRLDIMFSQYLSRLTPVQPQEVLLGAAFASRAIRLGHVCADLEAIASNPLFDEKGEVLQGQEYELPSLPTWIENLKSSPLVEEQSPTTPLVLDSENRLYLARYWKYQKKLADQLQEKAKTIEIKVSHDFLQQRLQAFFSPNQTENEIDYQMIATFTAILRKFCVITGGPGTGKTSTVVKILAILQESRRQANQSFLRILLLAPTGKAASRLNESIQQSIRDTRKPLPCEEEILRTIPEEASTIHRQLGYQARTPTQFYYNHLNPLPADLVLVDEASMIDIALMSKLVDALPDHARFILLGDKNQLASVEAGAILGDICKTGKQAIYSQKFAQQIEKMTGYSLPSSPQSKESGIQDCIVHLTKSYRFEKSSGIGALSDSIHRGEGKKALRILHENENLEFIPIQKRLPFEEQLSETILQEYRTYFNCEEPDRSLEYFNRFRVLCAHRRGFYGVERMNFLAEKALGSLYPGIRGQEWYLGRPVMITKNDYPLELLNGDIGITTRKKGEFRVFFPGKLKGILPARLSSYETVFAMTVHKSQGSEFNRVLLILPPEASPILTRELIYTGVTRAKEKVTIYGSEEVLETAIQKQIQRASGLREALW